jgi:signal peptidase I
VAATVVVLTGVVLLRLFALVDKLAYRRAAPHRGELAVFRAPGSGQILLKRIVAVGGDRIAIADGVLEVNGRREARSTGRRAVEGGSFGPLTVRTGSVFVLGDNPAGSADSRTFGPVALRRLIGRVLTRVWPPSRWGDPR